MKSKYLWLSTTLGLLLSVMVFVILSTHGAVVSAQNSISSQDAVAGEMGITARQQISTAYILVRFNDYDNIIRAVTFTTPISAYHALELSGLTFTTDDQGFGLFLCSIEEVGDSTAACDNGTQYWATSAWNAGTGSWDGRMVGIADAMITEDGHVEGFSWSDPGWAAVDPPPAPALTSAWRALTWLETQQQADGSFGNGGETAEVLMALSANRMDARDWNRPDGASALSAMWRQSRDLSSTPAGAGKLALALAAHESCWPFGALQPGAHYSDTLGGYDPNAGPHALAMLGTAALSQTIPSTATDYLLSLQQADGAWEWGIGWGTDTNATALALQAMLAAGEFPTSTAVISGLTYLDQAQNIDGGFPYSPVSQWGTDSDANSTAYVVQALLAAGEDPVTGTWVISDTNPIVYLTNLQLDDGSFEWQPGSGANQKATQQAATSLLYRPFPLRTAALTPCDTVFVPLATKN